MPIRVVASTRPYSLRIKRFKAGTTTERRRVVKGPFMEILKKALDKLCTTMLLNNSID
jgi:hypothetical protein